MQKGLQLEEDVFEIYSTKATSFLGGKRGFSENILDLLRNKKTHNWAKTRIGGSIKRHIKRRLIKLGLSIGGLRLVVAINSKADYIHGVDGIIYLPEFPDFVVTVDLFSIHERNFGRLKDFWISTFSGDLYGLSDLQNDLFLYKSGFAKFRKENRNTLIHYGVDYREFAEHGRTENHFIMTQLDTRSYEGRRLFGNMIAEYIHKTTIVQKEEKQKDKTDE